MKELEFNEVAKELKQEIDDFRHIEQLIILLRD